MADMKIAMTLTMADLASPEIQKFKENLAQLGDYLKKVSDTFKVTAAGASEFGKATVDASVGVRQFSRAIGGASRSGYRLGDVLKGLQDQIAGFRMEMASASATTSGMGAASIRAGAGLEAMGAKAAAAKGEMNGLHGTMKGLMELGLAFKIGEGVKKSVDLAAQYQNARIQLQNLNLPKSEKANILTQAHKWQGIPGISKLDALEAANAAVTGAPGAGKYQVGVREAIMPTILRAAAVLRSTYHDPNSVHDIVRNLLGIVEMRGKLQNIPAALKAVQTAFQVKIGSGNKISLQDQETAFRNMGYGEAIKLSTHGIFETEAMHEQFKASGKGGGAAGNTKASTITTMVAAAAMGGKMQKAQVMMLEQLKLLKSVDVTKIPGSSMVFVKPMSILNSAMATSDPFEWIRHTYDPHLRRLAKRQHPNMTPAELKNYMLDWTAAYGKSSGGVNTGTGYVTATDNEQWTSVQQRKKRMEVSATIQEATANAAKSLNMQMTKLHAVMHTLGVQIGTALLPPLTLLAQWGKDAGSGVEKLNSAVPAMKSIEAYAGALAGLLLGIKGVEWLLGIKEGFAAIKAIKLGSAMLKWAGAGATMAGRMAGLSGGLVSMSAKMLGAAGAAGALGFAVGTLLNKLLNMGISAATGGKETSLGGWVYNATHTSLGHYAHLRAMANAPIGAKFNNPGDLFPGGKFGHYNNPSAGLYAMASLLKGPAYYGSGLDTISQIVTKYAPPGQNDTAKYIQQVSSMMRVGAGTHLNLNSGKTLGDLMASMMRSEGTLKYFNPSDIQTVAKMVAGEHLKKGLGPNLALDHLRAEQAKLTAAVNPAGLGYEGPVTAQGQAKAKALAAKKAKETQDHLTVAQNKLSEAFRKRIEDALRFQAHLQNIAQSIHTAYQGIFDPLSSKIPAIQAKYRALSGYLLTNGHTKAAQEALAVGHHQVLGLQYKGAMGHLSNLQRTLHLGTTDNAALLKTGVITNAQATDRNIKLQQQMAPQMQKAAEAALKYAEALKDPALIASLKEQLANIGTMGKQLGYYGTKFKQSLQSSFNGLFTNLMSGQKTLGESFAAFFASIGKSLENQLSKSLSQSITDAIMGKKGSPGLGSLFSGITGMFSSVFGSGGSSSPSNPFAGAAILGSSAFSSGGSSWLSGAGGLLKGITSIAGLFGFASGADNIPNDMVANIHKGEMIIPAAGASLIRSGQAGIGGGGGPTLHMHINTIDSQDFLGHLHEIRAQATQMFLDTAQHLNVQGVG